MPHPPPGSIALRREKEQGSVLLICLILLIAVTLLGISSMNTTLVEHKIVSNTRSQTLALSAAETALSEAADLILAKSGSQQRTGIQLHDVQTNDAITSTNLNSSVNTVTVNLDGTLTLHIPMWSQGAVTNNTGYLGSHSRADWWANNANTTALSTDLSASNTKLDDNHFHLATNPRYMVEKGPFIPDDLSPNSRAEYRGRQAFTTIARATGSSAGTESSIQATVVTRFR